MPLVLAFPDFSATGNLTDHFVVGYFVHPEHCTNVVTTFSLTTAHFHSPSFKGQLVLVAMMALAWSGASIRMARINSPALLPFRKSSMPCCGVDATVLGSKKISLLAAADLSQGARGHCRGKGCHGGQVAPVPIRESPRKVPWSSLLSNTSMEIENRDARQKSALTGNSSLPPQSNQLPSSGASTKEVPCGPVVAVPHWSLQFTYGLTLRQPRIRLVMSNRRYSELDKPQAF